MYKSQNYGSCTLLHTVPWFSKLSSFIKNSNCVHILITCAPIQYTVIFRALKIAIVKWMKKVIFLIVTQNIDCGYLIELHQWGSSNEYPHSMFYC